MPLILLSSVTADIGKCPAGWIFPVYRLNRKLECVPALVLADIIGHGYNQTAVHLTATIFDCLCQHSLSQPAVFWKRDFSELPFIIFIACYVLHRLLLIFLLSLWSMVLWIACGLTAFIFQHNVVCLDVPFHICPSAVILGLTSLTFCSYLKRFSPAFAGSTTIMPSAL